MELRQLQYFLAVATGARGPCVDEDAEASAQDAGSLDVSLDSHADRLLSQKDGGE